VVAPSLYDTATYIATHTATHTATQDWFAFMMTMFPRVVVPSLYNTSTYTATHTATQDCNTGLVCIHDDYIP